MHLNLKNSIAFFDLEATGTNVSTDRIVEISIVKLNPDGGQQIYTRRVNPGVPIPLEASLIHGLYDKDLKNEPYFKDLAQEVFQFIGLSDLAGFNVLKYDIPLLVEEFLRSGIDFDLDKRNLLDAQKIFHLMEKRNLSAAYKFYCGKKLENAHSAEADTLATVDVFRAQVERYLGETAMDLQGNTLGVFENDMKKSTPLSTNGWWISRVALFSIRKEKKYSTLVSTKEKPLSRHSKKSRAITNG